jgi:O-antigen ligase
VSIALVNLPFSFDRGDAMGPLRSIILYYLVGITVIRAFRTPRSATALVFLLFVGQYIWFGLWGLKSGLVAWHPDLDNFDGYGPLMATGVGPAYFYATGASTRRGKMLGYSAAALCVFGVINSFARGAVLALIVTVGYIWLRSPKKGKVTAFLAAGALIVVIGASLIDGTTRGTDTRSSFWSEMSTMFDDSPGSTGDDRKVLWRAAVKVWTFRPVFGAGINQFGSAAANLLKVGDVGGYYAENPMTLWGRALHSVYFQILAEFGAVGILVFIMMLVLFWKRCNKLFTAEAAERWRQAGGYGDLRGLALGLESGMVGFLASGAFFNQLFTFWFYALIITCTMIYFMVVPQGQRGGRQFQRSGPPPRRSPARAPHIAVQPS